MELVANKLLKTYGHEFPIHVVNGWNKEEVRSATGWNEYLKQETGVYGENWCNYPAYLLLDEAQQSYWDDKLWAAFFKAIEPHRDAPFVILFSSYGSPNTGFASLGGKEHRKTPMNFATEQQISMRPVESIEDNGRILTQSGKTTKWHICRPVGLLLEEDEAIDVLTRYPRATMQPCPSISASLKKELFLITDGHVGCITSLLRILGEVRVNIPL